MSQVKMLQIKKNYLFEGKPEPPTAEIEKKIIKLGESEKSSIKCFTTGQPKPKVEWIFDNKPVSASKHFYALENILFVNSSIKQNGYLTCRASTPSHITESTSILVTGGDIKKMILAEIIPNKVELSLGDHVTLKCSLVSTYDLVDPIITWYDMDGNVIKNKKTNELKVDTNEIERMGNYSCQATGKIWKIKSNMAMAEIRLKPIEKVDKKIQV